MAFLEAHDLQRIYPSDGLAVHALRGVALNVERGSFVAIMGPSGSGKSTLANILGCLDRPTAGSYRFDGTEVSTLDRDALAALRNQRIGFVFQSFQLLPRTPAVENVELPLVYRGLAAGERRARAQEALTQLGLAGKERKHPTQLSGGEQQRVAIARALVGEPSLLLADEPTGNLDSHASAELMGLLQRLNAERQLTILLITHEPDVAAYAQRLLIIRDGLIADDRPVTQRTIAVPPTSGTVPP